jgi:hypothetical protein
MPIKASDKPVAAHDPSLKKRPNCQLFMGFVLKITQNFSSANIYFTHII